MKTNPQFWDKVSYKYSLSPVSDVKSWDETLDLARGYLKPTDSVLEIGAGTGSTALRICDAAKTYRATDYSEGMIAIANEKLMKSDAKNLSFAVATIADEMPDRYDAVLAFNLLHLIENIDNFAKEVHRALKPGGVFISKSACVAGKFALLRVPVGVMQLIGKAPYLNYFSQEKLANTIQGAGFEILHTQNLPKGSMANIVVARKI